jgi:hypothetical protein
MSPADIDSSVRELHNYLCGRAGKLFPPHIEDRIIDNMRCVDSLNPNDIIMMDPFIEAIYGNKLGSDKTRAKRVMASWSWGLMRPEPPVRSLEEAQRMVAKGQRYRGRWMPYTKSVNEYMQIYGFVINHRHEVRIHTSLTVMLYSEKELKESIRLDNRIKCGVFVRYKGETVKIIKVVKHMTGPVVIRTDSKNQPYITELDKITFPHDCKAAQRLRGVKI